MTPRMAGSTFLYCVIASLAAVQAAEKPDPHVPAFLLVAAADTPRSVAAALSEAKIPAGIQLPEDETPGSLSWMEERTKTGTVPLSQVLAAFRAAHSGYFVTIDNSVVVVSAKEVLKEPGNLLDRRVPNFAAADVSVRQAFQFVRRVFDSAFTGEGGTGGSLLSQPGESKEIDWGPSAGISVRMKDATVAAILNAIVAQAPGTVWLVSYRDHRPEYSASSLYYLRPGTMEEGPPSRSHPIEPPQT